MEGKRIKCYVLYNVASEKYLDRKGGLTVDIEKAYRTLFKEKAREMVEYMSKQLWRIKECKIEYEVVDTE